MRRPRQDTPAYPVRTESRAAALEAAAASQEKKGLGPIILDVRRVTLLADYFVIVGGESRQQVKAIVEAVGSRLETMGLRPRSVEGVREGRWVLMDYGDVIVHVLQERERNFYKLEQFWSQGLIVDCSEWVQDQVKGASQDSQAISGGGSGRP